MYGSSSTQSKGISIAVERSRPTVRGPSRVNGTIASSTVTDAIVMSSGWGLRTSTRISPGWNSTRRTSSSSAGGGLAPISEVSELPDDTNAAAAATSSTIGTSASSRAGQPRGRRRAGSPWSRQSSTTSKKPIQPSSANSDWCAWNMNRPALCQSISMIPRSPWHCTTVSVYSKWSVLPVR